MDYIIHFDIASILIMGTILVSYCIGKRLHDIQNLVLITMLVSNMTSAICDIVSAVVETYPFQGAFYVDYVADYLYFWAHAATAFTFCAYCVCMVGQLQFNAFWRKWIVYVPGIILIVTLVVQLFTPVIFYVDKELGYHRLNGILIVYAIAIFYTVCGIGHLLKYKKRTNREGRVACYAFASVGCVAILVQYFIPYLLVESIGLSICILLFYLAMEKPEELIDHELDMLNQKALLKVIRGKFQTSEGFTCVLLKVHNLKVMRQSIGVDCVNHLLRQMGEFMEADLHNATVFHFSQSVFVILLNKKNSQKDDVERVISKLEHRYTEGTWDDGDVETKFFIHLTSLSYPGDIADMDTFMNYLQYMRTNSSEHQNCRLLVSEMNVDRRNREMHIRKILADALENQGFEVFYQPIFSITDQRVVSAEALIRLKDQRLGFISPEEFIPIAEQSGAILRIGEYVFETVCKFIREENLKERGIHYIEINLSVVQCMQNNLADRLLETMKKYGIGAEQINLEITETAAVHTPEVLEKNIKMLYENGIQFSLDDYGSGYSNTDYLFRFPFKIVKIDKMILWEAFRNEKAMIALKNTIQMIKELGLEVVVEGVETEENVEYLKQQNCDFLQGYFYSKPVPKHRFLEILENE